VLRTINCIALIVLQSAARCCRSYIRGTSPEKPGHEIKGIRAPPVDWDAAHTAVNICLFPLIFFFSGLYYTDVLSTCIVIAAYEHFLQGEKPGSIPRGLFTYSIGVIALLMRQTNIFWVAVFLGGMEVARAFDGKRSFFQEGDESPRKSQFNDFVIAAYNGEYHDPKLAEAGFFGTCPQCGSKAMYLRN
jgi:alpha-1,2-glucosyltransferase